MKLLTPFILFFTFTASAQLNNSWIDYSKTYYKFKVASDNITKIPQTTLAAANLGTVNADHFQLWRNGKQVRLYTSVTNTTFTSTDFIEFFGEMNDGKADKELYQDPKFQLADRYSLETDTTVYFLTVNTVGNNLRYTNATNAAPGAGTPDAFFMRNVDVYYKKQLNRGFSLDLGESVFSSSYDNGEGFTSLDIGVGSYTETFSGLNVFMGGPANSLSIRAKTFSNTSNNTRTTSFKLFDNQVASITNSGTVASIIDLRNQPLSLLQNANTLPFTVTNISATPNRVVIATLGITYPATFDFNNQKLFDFELAPSSSGNILEISNFNYGTVAPILYDINAGRRYVGEIASTPGKVKFVLSASTEVGRKFILSNAEPANIIVVNSLVAKTFKNFNATENKGDYIIVTSPAFYNDGKGVNNVELYRAYRSTANGGGYNAKVVEIDELTDQFAFGIKRHPAAVRDFVRFMDVNYIPKPKGLFIIGRGNTYQDLNRQVISPTNNDLGSPNDNDPILSKIDFVPTFGSPASDVLLVSKPGLAVPITPVGRLSVINGEEIGLYYQKILEYEQAQRTQSPSILDKAWMKNSMQIVGGRVESESNSFNQYMEEYKSILDDTLFGAKHERFSKTSSSVIQQASSERITQLFQEGLGLISYFGHSSASSFEFNLSDPTVYNNTGKYPFFNVSGCSAGNFYNYNPARLTGTLTLSEKYIIAKQKGSIGFLADAHFGIPFALHNYNIALYQNVSNKLYGASVGAQIQDLSSTLGGNNPSLDYYTRIHLEEISLHGDPAVRINSFPKPDYVIENQSVSVSPNIVSVADPFFTAKIEIRNIGKAIKDSFVVSVKRILPNTTSEVIVFQRTIISVKNTEVIDVNIPINPLTDKGVNRLIFEVDATKKIDEIYETNNIVTKDVNILDDGLRSVFPYNYAIVNKTPITYTGSTANPTAALKKYAIEIDTTELFNSSTKRTYNIDSKGGAIQITPTDITYRDSVVYYWRSAVVPITGEFVWSNSSFVYLSRGTSGYNQSHYFQYTKNKNFNIDLDSSRIFNFKPKNAEYTIRAGIFPFARVNDEFSISNGGFVEQNGLAGPFGNNLNSLRFYVVDSISLRPKFNKFVTPTTGQFGSQPPRAVNNSQLPGYFQFDLSTVEARNVIKRFIDSIPNGDVLVMVNCGGNENRFLPAVWATDPGESLYNTLKGLGFSQIDLLTSHKPFVFAGRKGSNFPLNQTVALNTDDKLSVVFPVSGFHKSGNITSDVFGPAKKWKSLRFNGTQLETANNDKLTLQILGINVNGKEDSLGVIINSRDTSLEWINSKVYPKLRLKMFNTDSLTGTPNQLKYLTLDADFLPEGAVASNVLFNLKDTVEIGEPIEFSLAFKNISDVRFDSLMKITLKITTQNNFDSIISIPKGKILIAGDTLTVFYKIPSEKYVGKNTLFIEFNPANDQPEQFSFNNILSKNFFVKSDVTNPLLDVTFDGVHILNRDIVSAKPAILIKLNDESKFLALRDTGLLKVQITYPAINDASSPTVRNFYFNSDTLRFTPANLASGENVATINLNPLLNIDGEYELLISARDVSGNTAGKVLHKSTFTVLNKAMISELLNYPNPFTSSTAFVFTLTGSQVPQNLRIQILTITGKVVKEITKDELGDIKIGRNITDYKWDGTDMYGQKLANGVYIYRVITNLNGKSLEKYKTEADNTSKYFNKGYGKMYLMR